MSLQVFHYRLVCMDCQTVEVEAEFYFDATTRFGLEPDDGPATLTAEQQGH